MRLRSILLALSLVAVVAGCSDDPPVETGTRPIASPSFTTPSELVFIRGKELTIRTLVSDRNKGLSLMPSLDVALSPTTDDYVVVIEQGAGASSDAYEKPVLFHGSLRQDFLKSLGPGRSPVWSPDGDDVAAIEQVPGYQICDAVTDKEADADCHLGERVVVYPIVAGGAPKVALGAGRWSILGWTENNKIVGFHLDGGSTVIGFPGAASDETEALAYAPSDVWGVSPTEKVFLVIRDDAAEFVRLFATEVPARVELGQDRLGDGAWSPTGAHVAAVRLTPGGSSSLWLLETATGAAQEVPDSDGAQGQVLWTADGGAFAYVRIAQGDNRKLEVVVCNLELECAAEFSWARGVVLLGLR